MFFQETTPDTTGYMIAGYAVAFIVMALYVASIYLRARNLSQDQALLEEMDKPTPPVQASPAPQTRKSPVKAESGKPAKKTRKKY